jgi:hypothetical protein
MHRANRGLSWLRLPRAVAGGVDNPLFEVRRRRLVGAGDHGFIALAFFDELIRSALVDGRGVLRGIAGGPPTIRELAVSTGLVDPRKVRDAVTILLSVGLLTTNWSPWEPIEEKPAEPDPASPAPASLDLSEGKPEGRA